MNEKYLTLEQNICAARIFLNTFGFILEDCNCINEYSKIKIFCSDMNEVGTLSFNNGKVLILANYNAATLTANYDISKVYGLMDRECKNAPFALFGEWKSKINFKVKNKNTTIFNGEFLIDCSIDTEFGVNCICHPLINCEFSNKESITLKILRDGLTFGFEIKTNDCREKIEIRPWDELNGFFLHDILRGTYNEQKHSYPYRRYAGVFNGAETGEMKDKLHIFLKEDDNGKTIDFLNNFIQKVDKKNSRNAVIQKGILMKKLDHFAFEKIKELRTILMLDEISLLDNLVSVCYDSYTDEEVEALLDLKREKMNYQDGADCLINSYYGINKKSYFLSMDEQKRLLKK